ncbi:type 2 isopentenyl-diphosphate Delta-isomerase [Companilactobacillus ginsenosidimutans]|uniref:Isopentenyl-diphosphate delta-isomerase n=1 Tax=Companilactobacillus ginsenosidimutans TaxID=1007676 RepID=A0A0H4QIT3_9LACO|nr:type 2 isopentenyl-diphosphate Delta-isomerase [Companilactobacillus ginsenosidimutans]AKP66593.1 isopentenyl pyrophosphate isomerase [Companilactobacillus ginsenosidimutans]
MPKQDEQIQRKVEHLFLAEKYFSDESYTGFDQVRLIHDALPELKTSEIDLSTDFFGYKADFPFYFNAITGGSEQSKKFNSELAILAHEFNIPVSSGSMGVYFRLPQTKSSFTVLREKNPDGFVFANVSGKANLEQAQAAVDLVSANALQIHLNVIQELAMPEGDRDFNWSDNIKQIVAGLSVPVVVKEVGFGISKDTLEKISNLGVKNVDISGFGGTDFAEIESARNHDLDLTNLDLTSLSTVESLIESKAVQSKLNIFASGGIRSAFDVVKSLRMGAHAVGISGLALHHLQKYSLDETRIFFETMALEIKIIMAAIGAKNISEIQKAPVVFDTDLINYAKQRNINLTS